MKVTILGCGASGGVPRLGNQWGQCDPDNPRNRRNRSSIYVENGATGVLVDSGPDLRMQSLAAGIERPDGVLYTHDHADHVHGIDELRVVARDTGAPVDIYASQATIDSLGRRFPYAFGQQSEWYRPFVKSHTVNGPFAVGEVPVQPFEQVHGQGPVAGLPFRPDRLFNGPGGTARGLVRRPRGRRYLDRRRAGALRAPAARQPGPSAGLGRPPGAACRAILTHMTASLDYAELSASLPAGVEPAYDGMIIEVD